MIDFWAVLNAFQDYAWRVFWISSTLTVLEFVLPASRNSWVSRARGMLFYLLYIAISASALSVFNQLWSRLGIHPLVHLNFGAMFNSDYTAIRVIGVVAAPILAGSVSDFFYYWFHRLQHANGFLWRFHEVHHSIRELNAWNSPHHFSEEILRIPFVILPLSILVGPSPGPLLPVVGVIVALHGYFVHCNTRFHFGWFRYLVADNRFHRIHHSIEAEHCDRNFGAFSTIWDLVFRTAHFPRRNEWPDTGVPGVEAPRTVSDFLWMPFRPRGDQATRDVSADSGKPLRVS